MHYRPDTDMSPAPKNKTFACKSTQKKQYSTTYIYYKMQIEVNFVRKWGRNAFYKHKYP